MVFNFGWAPQLFGANRAGGRKHAGIDLGTGGKKDVPVGCPINGFKVHSVSYRKGYGNTVDLISEDGTKLMRFAHLAELPKHLNQGDSIQQGDWLGNVGNSGGNYAIHLHFEYRTLKNGKFIPINPFNNQYHTFSKNDFEQSTMIAKQSRQHIQSGLDLAMAQSYTYQTTNSTNTPLPNLLNLSNKGMKVQQPHQPAIAQGKISNLIQQNNDSSYNQSTVGFDSETPSVWTFEKAFEEPSWWERFMPVSLGGWSQSKINAADVQKKLDEEVFKGIQRKEMIAAGLSDQDIDLLRQFVDDQIKEKGVNYRLNTSSVQINFEDVFNDPQTAEIAKNFFNNQKDGSSGIR